MSQQLGDDDDDDDDDVVDDDVDDDDDDDKDHEWCLQSQSVGRVGWHQLREASSAPVKRQTVFQ